ncbi:MAG: chromosome segregation protein SMC, partial [Gemmobacter sp.]|nr:chromosome segregation protein SMC [Gemmobacter sp.]
LADRIAKMEANRTRFQTAMAAIGQGLGLATPPRWADLSQRLRDAEKAHDTRHRLLAEQADAHRAHQDDTDALIGVSQALDAIAADLCTDLSGLSATLLACRRATDLRRDITDIRATLADPELSPPVRVDASDLAEPGQGGPGLGTDDPMGAENGILSLDRSELEREVAQTEAEVLVLRQTSEDRFARLSEARRQLDAVGGDDAVARLDTERQTILMDLEDRAREHLARRLGIALVEQGLRRYRDGHRSAMLAHASDAFGVLSRGAYTGLAAQPDGPREVLMAQAQDGGAKLAADLSKGTRFQLYLALRIAGYHELARSRTPVPFVADDIMETFDDDRSAEAFTLLSDMARTGQVIYLTHHRHLCDIARAVCPGVKVLDLTAPG